MDTESDAAGFRVLFEQKEKEFVRLCVQKEKELADICEQQVKHLQQQVLDRDKNLADLREFFCSLKEDFKYNLELLDGRDAELSQYESELSELQESAKQAAKEIHNAHQKLAKSEFERLQERSRAEEKDKQYQRTLLDIRSQMEGLQMTREQLLTMHKQAFQTACAELRSEVEKKQVDMELQSKMLESQTSDKIRIHELQSQVVLDGVKNKLSVAEKAIKQLESERDAANEEYSQNEAELRDIIRERERIIKQLSAEMKQVQSENDNVRSIANLEFRKSTEQLRSLEAEHKQHVLQKKLQIEDLQRRLESAESRLAKCGQQPGQIAGYLEKVDKVEEELKNRGNEMSAKLEGFEAIIRKNAQLKDEEVQELKTEVAWWKSQHDVLLSRYGAQQTQSARGNTVEEVKNNLNFSRVPDLKMLGKKQDALALSCNLEKSPNIANIPLPQPQHAKGRSAASNSFGSSLPSPSPLPSPTFSNFEESFLLHQVNDVFQKITSTNTTENELVRINKTDDYLPHIEARDDKTPQLATLAKENEGLRKSVQVLKDQNERMRSVVGVMRSDMEALQATTLQKSQNSRKFEDFSMKCDKEEIRQLRDQLHLLASELQQLKPKNIPENIEVFPYLTPTFMEDQEIENFQTTEKGIDKSVRTSNNAQTLTTKVAELERVQNILQMQLQSATIDIMRITKERDCLMEISNSLHADFNRFVQQTNSKHDTISTRYHDNLQHIQNPTRSMANGTKNPSTHRPRTSPPKIPSRGSQGMQHLGLENFTSRGSRQGIDLNTQPRNLQPNEEGEEHTNSHCLQLEGKMESLKQRPEVLPDYVHKGIPSQRQKLKLSIKTRESQLASQMASRPKVRNYNIKDDDTCQ